MIIVECDWNNRNREGNIILPNKEVIFRDGDEEVRGYIGFDDNAGVIGIVDWDTHVELGEQVFDEADDMCPNCVTPWKCNGPHLPEQTVAYLRNLSE